MTNRLPDLTPANWMYQAACTVDDAELFFPNTHIHYDDIAQAAKQICSLCPVVNQCLELALAEPSLDGIWGGLTPRERHTLRRKARP